MSKKVLMKLEQVTKVYQMGEVKVEALKETSLDIYQGELMVILGPSGSGKSTLLNIMGGLDLPTGGKVLYGNQVLSQAGDAELTEFRRTEIGFVFQFYNLIYDLTSRENVELAANLVDEPLYTEEILGEVGLSDRMDHFPSQLSGGEQQRVSIARAAVKKPQLLLCDEPTGALDDKTGKKILDLLLKFNRQYGSTVVIVTHNSAIGNMANRVIRMRSGVVTEIIENAEPLPPERIEW
ncbi:ABC transporter ATP-binding protein [Desulfofalx alkaliphila]|uniref:ABC transporter ATP-binding protein n=1 Tax=Desulfofalx alkaliphila TaxID=105483 RepID=UPI0004E1EC43|nr:ABC transporter ATP-binding protein [Desulfofalx alkaliphila]